MLWWFYEHGHCSGRQTQGCQGALVLPTQLCLGKTVARNRPEVRMLLAGCVQSQDHRLSSIMFNILFQHCLAHHFYCILNCLWQLLLISIGIVLPPPSCIHRSSLFLHGPLSWPFCSTFFFHFFFCHLPSLQTCSFRISALPIPLP